MVKDKSVKKIRRSSLAFALVLLLVAIIVVATFSNIRNISSIKSTNTRVNELIEVTVENMVLISETRRSIEAVQKHFYTYVSPDANGETKAVSKDGIEAEKRRLLEALSAMEEHGLGEQVAAVRGDVDVVFGAMDTVMTYADNAELTNDSTVVEIAKKKNLNSIKFSVENMDNSLSALYAECEKEMELSIASSDKAQKVASSSGIVLALVTIATGIFGMLFAIFRIALPMKKASHSLNKLVEEVKSGNADLNQKIQYRQNDEIGDMLNGFNAFMQVLSGLINQIKDGSATIDQAAKKVNEGVTITSDRISDTSATMEELAEGMSKCTLEMEHITNNLTQISEEIHSMAGKTSEGLEFSDAVRKRADDLKNKALVSQNNAKNVVDDITDKVERAIDESKKVSRINELTQDILAIANKTNLLALNASIEAARAGEAGRGFAVVADEIRQLADQSKETAGAIQEISDAVTNAVGDLAGNAGKMLQFVNSDVVEAYADMVETGVVYHDDAEEMKQLMSHLQDATEGLNQASEKIRAASDAVLSAVLESSLGINNVADNIADISGQVNEMSESVENNMKVAHALKKEVAGFQC